MPASKLEDSPINFKVTVPDYTNPSVRIDATVQRLNLEVMNLFGCRGRRRHRRSSFQFRPAGISKQGPAIYPSFK